MADSYEELVELGFEGVDRFATHFHDPVFGYVSKHKPRSKGKRDSGSHSGQGQRERKLPKEEVPAPRQDSPQQQESYQGRSLPPHPQWNLPPPPPGPPPNTSFKPGQLSRERSYSEPRGDRYDSRSLPDNTYDKDSNSDDESFSKSMYSSHASDHRRGGSWRDDDRYERTVEEREYYRPNGGMVEEREYYRPNGGAAQQMVVRSRDANRYQGGIVPRAPSPPPDVRYDPRAYNDGWAVRDRRLPQRQQSSSWSPQRRPERRHESPSRRRRSKSPGQYRGLATVVGALVGGAAGSQVKKGQSGTNTIATVGGAIIGGIAARELEQQYDRRQEREEHRAYRRGEAREKRRLEREYNYD